MSDSIFISMHYTSFHAIVHCIQMGQVNDQHEFNLCVYIGLWEAESRRPKSFVVFFCCWLISLIIYLKFDFFIIDLLLHRVGDRVYYRDGDRVTSRGLTGFDRVTNRGRGWNPRTRPEPGPLSGLCIEK